MKKFFSIIAVVMGFSMSVSAADIKIGFVDLEKAIQATSAGKKAKEILEKEFNEKKKDIQKKEADLKKMNEDLEKKNLVLSEEMRAKKRDELQAEMMKYNELVRNSQMGIQKKERELTEPILKKLRDIIEKTARTENYTVILEKSERSVLWAQKEVDLTDKIITEFEKSK